MPNVNQLLRSLAREMGVDLGIVHKDYAISYLLAAMARTPGLGEKIVLKGGTALRKLYYPAYRFSEDLDYSTQTLGVLPNADELLRQAVVSMAGMLQERGPFDAQVEPLTLRQPHPGQQMAYTVRVRFPDQRQALCRLKVEITVDEPIFLEAREHPILHGFGEKIETGVRGYALEEIVAEKLRALLQSWQKLSERGWGASRVCRDYYDLWYILGQEKLTGIPKLFAEKCQIRKVAFHSPEELINPDLIEMARREWDQQLSPFLTETLKADNVIAEVQTRIQNLF
jgi:predicted nucleotidyltransferase component of viral defense system